MSRAGTAWRQAALRPHRRSLPLLIATTYPLTQSLLAGGKFALLGVQPFGGRVVLRNAAQHCVELTVLSCAPVAQTIGTISMIDDPHRLQGYVIVGWRELA